MVSYSDSRTGVRSQHGGFLLHAMFNAWWEPLSFEMPAVPAGNAKSWRRCIDTALDSPDDIQPWAEAPPVRQSTYRVEARSPVALALVLPEPAK